MAAELNWGALCETILKDLLTRIPDDISRDIDGKRITEYIAGLSQWRDEKFQDGLQNSLKITNPVQSDQRAEQLRIEGNKFFQQKLYHKALSHYSKAVLYASDLQAQSSTQLSLAYANRSAALYFLEHWKPAIEDVDRAIVHGYPAEQKFKLLIRKGECLMNDGRKDDALEVLKLASESLTKSKLSSTEAKAKRGKISGLVASCTRLEDGRPLCKNELVEPMRENSRLQNASEAVTLSFSPEKGRHLIAKTSVSAGDVIIREIPFAAVLLPDHHETHCHHCCSKTLAPVMCSQCIHVQYCSGACRDTAWTRHHQIECSMWDILKQVGTFSHLGLRIVLNASIHRAPNISPLLDRVTSSSTANQIPGCRADGSYHADYDAVYSLQTHMDRQAIEDISRAAVDGYLLSTCVRLILHDGNTVNWDTLLADPEVCSLATLICHHILQLRTNIHAITAVQAKEGGDCGPDRTVTTTEQKRIASAVYPTTSLMNHGCHPNVIASFHNNQITIRATRPIEEGEEICHCYGPHVNHMSTKERQQRLKDQYYFACQCSACSTPGDKVCDWTRAFRCSKCDRTATLLEGVLECSDGECSYMEDASEKLKLKANADQLYHEGIRLLEEGSSKKCLDRLHRALHIHHSVFFKHHRAIAEDHDSLARCYAERGDFSHSVEHLDEAIVIVKRIYGERSIEVAQELHKLAQILFNGQQIERAKVVISEAMRLLSRHHGNSHEAVQELLEMQTCLMSL